jgi:riboflavin synthase
MLECKICRRRFSETRNATFFRSRYGDQAIHSAIRSVVEGAGVRAAARMTGLSKDSAIFSVFLGATHSKFKIQNFQTMFSGIVEATARVTALEREKENLHITLECPFAAALKVDQSVAHNGVCLTVVRCDSRTYTVTAIWETLQKSNLGLLSIGDEVNVERSIKIDSLLDGHLVQGHVDQTAVCSNVREADGSWYFTFTYDPAAGNITVEKGSIAVNGVSLTVVNSQHGELQVAIIPYTYEHTNFHAIKEGTVVNLEFDVVGKYIAKLAKLYMGALTTKNA